LMADVDYQVYAAGADDLEHSADALQKIIRAIAALKERTFGNLQEAVAYGTWDHRSARFKYDVLPKFGIAPTDHWRTDAKKAGILDKLDKTFQKFQTHCRLIVSTFDKKGCGAQFLVSPEDGGWRTLWVLVLQRVRVLILPGLRVSRYYHIP
jgi:hypothetical protein